MADSLPNTPQTNLKPFGGFRSPTRITITISYGTYERLIHRSNEEGRSLSNLSAFLLESAIESNSIAEITPLRPS